MSDLPRKNCWTLAEHAGDANPYGLQHLVSRAKWDADAVRDDICGFVVEHLHDEDAVLVVDETGDLKKGAATVGVQRQYTGTAGRIENSQVGWLSRLLHPSRARGDRPGAVCPAILDRVPGPLPGRRDPRQRRLRHGPALAARMIGRALEPRSSRPGWPATRSTEATRTCGPSWRSGRSATGSRSQAIAVAKSQVGYREGYAEGGWTNNRMRPARG